MLYKCNKCGYEGLPNDFARRANNLCKKCRNEYDRQQHKTNPTCKREYDRQWRKANIDKCRGYARKWIHKKGAKPMDENKDCPLYLGIHIAERILSYVFKNVQRMPLRNRGFDFICSHEKKIDVKSGCIDNQKGRRPSWYFDIKRNTIADYFLCLAFDNRNNLNPMYIWLIPGYVVNKRKGLRISLSTIVKWNEFRLDIDKVQSCCNVLRNK